MINIKKIQLQTILILFIVMFAPASTPIATLFEPVVRSFNAQTPTAVIFEAVVKDVKE
jgi:hypothetical protein